MADLDVPTTKPSDPDDDALTDVLRLSRGMTYKSALAGIPFGGGKSVIIGDPRHEDGQDPVQAAEEPLDNHLGSHLKILDLH